MPNAIGGQSGSGVWGDDDNLQKALLTWSIRQGNRWYGGGQLTNAIYDQMRGRVVRGYPRPADWEFVELSDEPDYDTTGLDDPVVEESYWTTRNDREMWPIWFEDQKPIEPPIDPGTPVEPGEWKKRHIETLRKYRDQIEADLKDAEQSHSGCVDPGVVDDELFGL